VLHLKLPTDPRWVDLTAISVEDILTDHAYCEQKAASSGISLIQNFSQYEYLVNAVTPLVSEEWGHFRLVLKELRKRNLKLGKQRKDEYASAIVKFQHKGGRVEDQLLEKLMTLALIEARSCERFRLLSENLEEEYLRNFYRHFMESEAGHYTLFMDIAREYIPAEKVNKRWQEYLNFEEKLLGELELRGDRIH
jgi:tRNA-(ms[2]io[6]A)-hydroxylase